MKKKYLEIVDFIPEDLIEKSSRKEGQNLNTVEFVIRNKKIKISKIKDKDLAVITFEKNNIGGVLFHYGVLDKKSPPEKGTSIRLFQKGFLKDREVGFLKISRN